MNIDEPTFFATREEAIAILRAIDAGDESAFNRIAPLLARIDGAAKRHQATQEAATLRRTERSKRGRKHSGKFEIAKQLEDGCDHSTTGIVLLRHAGTGHRLVWRSGAKFQSGIGQTSYGEAHLQILIPGKTMPRQLEWRPREAAPARLSKALLSHFAVAIDEVFGKGATVSALALERTIIVW